MQVLVAWLTRYGEIHLSARPPGAIAVVVAAGVGVIGVCLFLLSLVQGALGPTATAVGLMLVLPSVVVVQTASLQYAHHRRLARLR